MQGPKITVVSKKLESLHLGTVLAIKSRRSVLLDFRFGDNFKFDSLKYFMISLS
jgi:hypothetical protein